MNPYRVQVMYRESSPYTDLDIDWIIDRDADGWSSLMTYLGRLSAAGVIEDWEANELENVFTPLALLDTLVHENDARLEEVESGYEDKPRDGGDDPQYRHQMNDAGRRGLLR